MDRDRRDAALGALALALVLILSAGVGRLASVPRVAPTSLDASAPPVGTSRCTAAALGWPVRSDEADPCPWEQLDGVGSTLGARLAGAASQGALRAPEDLLQVRGIGARMAADLAPHITWVGRE